MKNELNKFRETACKMLRRAEELGINKDGKALVVDLMEELIAAGAGYRNAHAYRAAMKRQETPALSLENPAEAGTDYVLAHGTGFWAKMGNFSVHPYLTGEGVVVDVYANGAEHESIASTYAFDSDAEDAVCAEHSVDIDAVAEWVGLHHRRNFDTEPASARITWILRYAEAHQDTESLGTQGTSDEKACCDGCGLPTTIDDDGLCNQCAGKREGTVPIEEDISQPDSAYRVKVYDDGADPLWGEVRVNAADEFDAMERVLAYLTEEVSAGRTDLNLNTVKLNPVIVEE